MVYQKLITITKAQEVLKTIPFLNCGGCGISALAIYRFLRKNNVKQQIKFVYMYSYYDGEEFNNKDIPEHICLLIGKQYIDGLGNVYGIDDHKLFFVTDEKVLLDSINTKDWNDMFDRNNIKTIQSKLKVDLSDVEEWTER